MDNQTLDLGVVSSIVVESFGEPGQRTFRIHAQTSMGQVSLWLEKEQVVMLGKAILELLERVPAYGEEPESDALRSFSGELQVKVGSLAVGYNEAHHAFTLEASDFESPFDVTSIVCFTTRDQFAAMGEQIDEIVSAGRPRCPLCATPLTGGPHFCPESNGHSKLARPSEA